MLCVFYFAFFGVVRKAFLDMHVKHSGLIKDGALNTGADEEGRVYADSSVYPMRMALVFFERPLFVQFTCLPSAHGKIEFVFQSAFLCGLPWV
uniref:Secreted protein n=1 Tax=Ditylenchus dipsaci TaxID=166011 RepID=A0A915EUY5_9BILA